MLASVVRNVWSVAVAVLDVPLLSVEPPSAVMRFWKSLDNVLVLVELLVESFVELLVELLALLAVVVALLLDVLPDVSDCARLSIAKARSLP